jgi:hypothetical protein
MMDDIQCFVDAFERQINVNVGGLYNPKIVFMDENEIEFRCNYDNYEDDEDSWTWYFDRKSRRFYN